MKVVPVLDISRALEKNWDVYYWLQITAKLTPIRFHPTHFLGSILKEKLKKLRKDNPQWYSTAMSP